MFFRFLSLPGIFAGCVALSGCTIVSSDTSIAPIGSLSNDLISRSGTSEGPNNAVGNSFTSVIDWAQVGGGQAGLDSSVVTFRHASAVVSPSGQSSSGMPFFSVTDSYSVEGGRDNTMFVPQAVTASSILSRVSEVQGTAPNQQNFVAYTTVGFETSYADIVSLGSAGGRAVYRGSAFAELFDGSGASDAASGTATVNVDFGANEITGALVFRDALEGAGGPDLGDFQVDINSGSLAGNTFSTSMSTDPAAIGAATVSDFNAKGSLYGAQGADMGGSFATTATAAGTGDDLVLIGGFLAGK